MSSQNNAVFGNTTVLLQGSPEVIRTEESNLGNLTADAILATAKEFDDSVAVSLTRGGNFFSSIESGDISRSDIEKTLALNSNLILATVTAQELRDLLEFGVASDDATSDRFPQVGGLKFSYDPDQTAIEFDSDGNIVTPGQKIRSLEIVNANGEIVDVVVEDGEIAGESDRAIRLVAPKSLIEPALNILEPEVFFSVDNPVISFVQDRGFILQDTDLGSGELVTLFDLDATLDDVDIDNDNDDITITDVNILVSPELSTLLTGSADLAGVDIGDAQIDGSFTEDGTNIIVNGGVTSVALDTELLASVGLDIANIIDTVEPADGFDVGFSIVETVIDTEPLTIDLSDPLASEIEGSIDHIGRVVFTSNENFNSETFDSEVFASIINPVISFVEDRGFVLQETDLGTGEPLILSDISIAGDVNIESETLNITDADLLVSPELAEYFGNSNLEGIHIGNAQIDGTLTPDGDNFILNGGTTSINLDLDFSESLGLTLANAIDVGTPAAGFAVGLPIVSAEDDDDPFVFSDENGLTPISGDIDHQGQLIFDVNDFAATADVYPLDLFAEDIVDLQDALQISVDNPIINFIAGRGFVLQDTDFGTDDIVTLFDLEIPDGEVNVGENTLDITNTNLLVAPEFAEALGDPTLAGTDLGDAQVNGLTTPDGDNFAVNGGVTSVNLDTDLLATLGLSLFSVTSTGTPADGFAVGFPIVGEADEDPFVFSTENGLTPVSGDIDHEGRVVLEPSGNANFAGEGSEQDALAEYLSANFPDADNAFDEADTPARDDTRIRSVRPFIEIDVRDQVGPFDFSSNTNNLKITAGDRDDEITSGSGNDLIDAGGGNNTVNAGSGNDEIIGSGQPGTDNQFDGGEGFDTVTYDGVRDDFSVARFPGDIVRVGSNTDTLRNVEQLQFTDQTVPVSDLPEIPLDDTVIRFRNENIPTGTYLFAGEEEAESIRRDFRPPFVEEGEAFNVSFEANDALVVFNRFRNRNLAGTYLYANEEESESIRDNFSDVFIEEGIAFYAYGADYGVGQDVIRFRNVNNNTYLFALEEEAQSIEQNFSDTFVREGAAFEVPV